MINEEDKRIIEKVQKINCNKGDILLFYYNADQLSVSKIQYFFKNIAETLSEQISAVILPTNIQLFSVENYESMMTNLQNCISQLQKAKEQAGNIENGEFSHDVILDFKDGGIRQRDFYTCGPRHIGQE